MIEGALHHEDLMRRETLLAHVYSIKSQKNPRMDRNSQLCGVVKVTFQQHF